ncbi:hypothetical protein GCM10023185_09620 [Hymenobacter saemangeumensis]|uniref:LamG-like jellyroll fold domain-containing protein n=2 Tax=Hymenobacter saemangeumensis TaxID=1084522 RepID=A0ABP8I4F6_9BACT
MRRSKVEGAGRPASRVGIAAALAWLPLLALAQAPVLQFSGTVASAPGVDVTAFVDMVEIVNASTNAAVAGVVANPSFESGTINGTFDFAPSGASWAFSGRSGIGSIPGAYSVPTTNADGSRTAILQSWEGQPLIPSFSQTLGTLAPGTYFVRLRAAQRNTQPANQGVLVRVNGVALGTFTPLNNNSFQTFSTSTFTVTAPNNALAFNPANSPQNFVALPSTTPLPVNTSAYTIEAWIRPNAMGGCGIIGWGNYGTFNQVNAFRLDGSNGGQLINYWWGNDLVVNVGNLSGSWHHVAVTYNGTARTMYLNGNVVGSDTPGTAGRSFAVANARIGSTNNGEIFNGAIDEVRVYSTALTQAQVQADMNTNTSSVPGSLASYYDFNQGTPGGNNAGLTSLPNLASGSNPGTLQGFTLSGTSSNWVGSFTTLSSLSPTSGPVGTSVTLTGTNFTGATSVTFNGTAATSYTVNSATSITATVPAGATSGVVRVTSPSGISNGVSFTVVVPDLTVSAAQSISGNYNNVTITGTGVATLNGSLTVNGTLTVQSGGSLNTNCQTVGGVGAFALQAGATLRICDPAGISSSGASGAVQVSGTRSFSTDASYVYNGTAAQVTGAGLPSQVRSLSTTNSSPVTLSQPLSVAQVLTVGGSGNLNLNGQALMLLSDAAGSALVVNSGSGVVVGGTASVQRYINPSTNPGPGYRHYSAPVTGSTVADLTTTGFMPVVNPAFNSAAAPASVTPFPTVFGYDQVRLASATNNLDLFSKGWVSPTALTDALVPGRGYSVNIGAGEKVDFTGTLNTGNLTLNLSRNTGATAAEAGWHHVGNPYPAPLDYSLVTLADRNNLDGAIYVFESSSQYGGMYRSYVNGIGGNPVLPSGQGFWVRVSQGQTSGTLTFRNSQRLTSPNATAFSRGAADQRPQLKLTLSGQGVPSDELTVYAEAGATTGADSEFDAVKLPNTTGLNLSALASSGQQLAIQGLPSFSSALVPLTVQVPAAGTYTFEAAELPNLPAGTRVYLRDGLAGTSTLLAPGTAFRFSLSGTTATGRFALELRGAGALATSAQLLAQQVTVFPNPAHQQLTLTRPLAGATNATATLLNSLGQVLRTVKLTATQTEARVDLTGLAAGVYSLRVPLADGQLVFRRVVVE